jgi:hypothetical protein
MEDKIDETRKEKEDGGVQEHGHGPNGPGHAGTPDTVVYVCPDTCAFMRRATALRELQITSGPLLQ